MTTVDTHTMLDCGHAPQPTYYAGTDKVLFSGYATLPDSGRKVCPDCADDMHRAQLAALKPGGRFYGYLSSDGRRVTSWTGGELARVTRVTGNARQTFIRAVANGVHYAGVGPAESGTYVALRLVRAS